MDISPGDFVSLTLPIYKAMSPMAGPLGVPQEEMITMFTTANHYTSVSFIRLLALASRRLRLSTLHFMTVLHAMMDNSGMILATNLSQEQVSQHEICLVRVSVESVRYCDHFPNVTNACRVPWRFLAAVTRDHLPFFLCMFVYAQMILFHVMGLARQACNLGAGPVPLDARRVVLLVPKSGLSLLREFKIPRVYMSVTGATKELEVHSTRSTPLVKKFVHHTCFCSLASVECDSPTRGGGIGRKGRHHDPPRSRPKCYYTELCKGDRRSTYGTPPTNGTSERSKLICGEPSGLHRC